MQQMREVVTDQLIVPGAACVAWQRGLLTMACVKRVCVCSKVKPASAFGVLVRVRAAAPFEDSDEHGREGRPGYGGTQELRLRLELQEEGEMKPNNNTSVSVKAVDECEPGQLPCDTRC